MNQLSFFNGSVASSAYCASERRRLKELHFSTRSPRVLYDHVGADATTPRSAITHAQNDSSSGIEHAMAISMIHFKDILIYSHTPNDSEFARQQH